MSSQFISYDKNYIIEIERKQPSIFQNNGYYNFICILTFKNNLGSVLKEIRLSDVEILSFIDNVYNFLEFGSDSMIHYLNTSDSSLIDNIIKITLDKNTYAQLLTQTFYLYTYQNESMIEVLSFDISNNLVELIDIIYNEVYYDTNNENIKLLDPNNFLL